MHISLGEQILFWCVAPLAVIGALGLLFARKAIYAAVGMITTMLTLACLYIMNEADFLGIVQIVVYTGAIMMLFLFVLMLVGVDANESRTETIPGQRIVSIVFSLGMVFLLVSLFLRASYPTAKGLLSANAQSNPVGVAHLIFGPYVFAFLVLGVLLTTAAVGALVLTHRDRLLPKVGQKELVELRTKVGHELAGKPMPGVYARSNALDVPALGPDGQPVELSRSRVLVVRGQQRTVAKVAARTRGGSEGEDAK